MEEEADRGPDWLIGAGIIHAFYLAATMIGGRSWLRAGRIWYRTMLSLTENSRFKDMVKTTVAVAATEFGRNSKEHKAVKAAWKEVGL